MARYRGLVHGNRGPASRLGTTHITTTTNGWNVGVRVIMAPNDNGTDSISIFKTGGSGGDRVAELIAEFNEGDQLVTPAKFQERYTTAEDLKGILSA
jgi:hypothetical protein